MNGEKEYFSREKVDFAVSAKGSIYIRNRNVLTPLVRSSKIFRMNNEIFSRENIFYPIYTPLGIRGEYLVDFDPKGKHDIRRLTTI
ncbi:MAG TPA: hypothetical protein VJ485_02725 [archaeon]|nr:hypothetical protein [archaeon]